MNANFEGLFPKIEKLTKHGAPDPYADIVAWFFEENDFELLDSFTDAEYKEALDKIGPLKDLVDTYQKDALEKDRYFLKEVILWALAKNKKLSKFSLGNGIHFKDVYGSYISGLQ